MSASPWTSSRRPHRVFIPVVDLDLALPHMRVPADVRRVLAVAFAADTVRAATKARLPLEVVVVTPDPLVRTVAERHGARTLPGAPGSGIGDLLRSARAAAERDGLDGPTALLAGTLPCLLPNELDSALMSRADRCVEVLDLGGQVATLRTDTNGWPAPGSPYAHESVERFLRRRRERAFLPGLACHVDTVDGLRIAAFLGVGPATDTALADLDLPALRAVVDQDPLRAAG